MKNSKEIPQAENCNEEVKQKSKIGSKVMQFLLFLMLLISLTTMSSCWWGRDRGYHDHDHHEDHHEEHHDDHH
jgi:hypothetical protein